MCVCILERNHTDVWDEAETEVAGSLKIAEIRNPPTHDHRTQRSKLPVAPPPLWPATVWCWREGLATREVDQICPGNGDDEVRVVRLVSGAEGC